MRANKAVKESLEVILPAFPHALEIIKGKQHNDFQAILKDKQNGLPKSSEETFKDGHVKIK